MTNDVVKHDYAMKFYKNLRGQGLESLQVGLHVEMWGE